MIVPAEELGRMARSVAINVGANTNAPGVRGPIYPDGSFEFVPIPESEPVREPVPTYDDIQVSIEIPNDRVEMPVHFDPEFAELDPGERYTYGDPYGVKARPLLDLEEGDLVAFYATLDFHGEDAPDGICPDWGAYIIGRFRLARDPIAGEAYETLPAETRALFRNNAHVKRETFDARVLLHGNPDDSGLLETAIPLSNASGTEPNRLVAGVSSDSGKGPWWRRPLRFDESGTEVLEGVIGGDLQPRASTDPG